MVQMPCGTTGQQRPLVGECRDVGIGWVAHSVGSKGDFYETAMDELINAFLKAEPITMRIHWRAGDNVELANLG